MGDQNQSVPLGKPQGAICRNAKQLVPLKEYKIKYVYQELSHYENFVTKKHDLKAICVYDDLNIQFYTYLCKDYDNKPAEEIQKYNDDINAGKNIRLIYYGSVGNYNMSRLLLDGEKPNKEAVQGMKSIANAQTTTYFMKRKRDEDDDDEDGSPKKSPLKPAKSNGGNIMKQV